MSGALTTQRRAPGVSRAALGVAGISLVALALRIAAFDESFYADELFTYEISTRPDLHAVLAGVRSDLEITPPLFFALAWVFQKAGDPFVWLRIPSLLAGVATVPVTYLLGVRTVGRSAALVASGLLTLSPTAIFYATEARAYALMTLLVVLSTIALLRAIETNDRRWWATLALLEAAAMYSHYTAAFVLAAQAAWGLWFRRDRVKPQLIAHGAAVLLYVPWVPFLLEDADAPAQKVIGILEPFTPSNAIRHLGRLVEGAPFVPLRDLPGTAALVLLGVAAAIGVVGLAWRARRTGTRALPDRVVLVVAIALAAPLGAALYSLLSDDMFVVRNLIASLPGMALAFAALLTALPRAASAAAVTLAFVALGLAALGTFDKANQRPAYEEVADFIEANVRPGDVVLERNEFPEPPGLALQVHVDPDIRFFKMGFPYQEEQQAADTAAAEGGRVLFGRPGAAGARGDRPLPVARRFEPGETRTWKGLHPLTLVVYEPR